ncbi:hypothetical protein C6P45_000755 [Maudiozyma exigua]|uniref:Uncharacterized protein n=1 Tax=Maudiozyma exigua TaxID=34358 RepID=A0A9P6W3L7_MAUEX|nr:hypothetical protein C6P45_000755 [Kazachstania exigua]
MRQFLQSIEKAFSTNEKPSEIYITIDDDDSSEATIKNNSQNYGSSVIDAESTMVANNEIGTMDKSDNDSEGDGYSDGYSDNYSNSYSDNYSNSYSNSDSDSDSDSDCQIIEIVKKNRKLAPFPVTQGVTKEVTIDFPKEIEIKDRGKNGKYYSVLDPKTLSNEYKMFLSKRCTRFGGSVKNT